MLKTLQIWSGKTLYEINNFQIFKGFLEWCDKNLWTEVNIPLNEFKIACKKFYVDKTKERLTFKTDSEEQISLSRELTIVLGINVLLKKESTENIQRYLQKNYRKITERKQNNALYYSEDFLLNII